ncbi:DUF4190 domain-containing protein [Fibrella sp. HMF5335]|uniref:DUF4190 domain-containing protein n=1 Tax=Fibrella rubiginis TaxID=2817060 RepID=A0A939GIF5_9BACT|nr:DUF4190 domain-containing protein [Fibrella rubiginis]MBO0939777.1 DUF4190 domain-containing protein [Fibrella rubiginis]
MNSTLLRLLVCLFASYLLTACQANQYGFFQASNTVHHTTEQPDNESIAQVNQNPVQDSVQQSASATADTAMAIPHSTSPAQVTRKAENRPSGKAIRSALRATHKQYQAKPVESTTNGLATASFFAGLLAMILLFVPGVNVITIVLGPLALILGIVSFGQIRRKGQRGLGLGIAGTVLGGVYILLVLFVIAALSGYR